MKSGDTSLEGARRAFRKLLRARIRDYAATEKDADREFEEALRG